MGKILLNSTRGGASPPAPPVAELVLSATLDRWTGEGSYRVTNGVVFKEGDLTEAQETAREISVTVTGVEQSIYTEPLDGRWPDGSIKSCMIQFDHNWTGSLSAEISVGTVRGTSDATASTFTNDLSGILALTDENYLCSGFPLWYDITPTGNHPTAPDPFGVMLDSIHSEMMPRHDELRAIYDAESANKWYVPYSQGADYDYPKNAYTYYCMTGKPRLLNYMLEALKTHTQDYLIPNNWTVPEHNGGYGYGMLLSYWLTGWDIYGSGSWETVDGLGGAGWPSSRTVDSCGSTSPHRTLHNYLHHVTVLEHLGQPMPSFDNTNYPTTHLKAQAYVDELVTRQEPEGDYSQRDLGYKDATIINQGGTWDYDANSGAGETTTGDIPNGSSTNRGRIRIKDGQAADELRFYQLDGTALPATGENITGLTSGATGTIATIDTCTSWGEQPWQVDYSCFAAQAYSSWISGDRDTEIYDTITGHMNYLNNYAWETNAGGSGGGWDIYNLEGNGAPSGWTPAANELLNGYTLGNIAYILNNTASGTYTDGLIATGDLAVQGYLDDTWWQSGEQSYAKAFNQINRGTWQYIAARTKILTE